MWFRPIERVSQWLRLSSPSFGTPGPEELIQRGATHFAQDFPNPAGDDCVPVGVLNAVIDAGALPSDEIREHLLTCSVCFGHYRDELARHREGSSVANRQSSGLLRTRLIPIVGAGIAGVLAVAAITYIVLTRNAEPADGVASVSSNGSMRTSSPGNDRSASTAPAEAPREDRSAPLEQQPLPTPGNSRQLIARNNVNIDLEMHTALRSPEASNSHPVVLRRMVNTLTLKLPADSPRGKYEVSLANPYGRFLKTVEAVSPDGMSLRVDLNLSSFTPGDYLICLGRKTEAPQCVLASVEPVRKKNK